MRVVREFKQERTRFRRVSQRVLEQSDARLVRFVHAGKSPAICKDPAARPFLNFELTYQALEF